MWLFTIGLFWAAFNRERGSYLNRGVSGCLVCVGRLDSLHHPGRSGQRPMEEGVKVSSLTRDRALAFPSVPPSSTVTFAPVF